MDEALLPAPALVPDPEPVPDPALDVDPRLDPKPPKFGLVGTLQNVAVISSWQITPVFGSCELFLWPFAPIGCCICDVCAATGDAAISSATVNASIFTTGSIRWCGTVAWTYSANDIGNKAGTHPPLVADPAVSCPLAQYPLAHLMVPYTRCSGLHYRSLYVLFRQ